MNELAEKKKGKQVGPRLTPKATEFYEENFGDMTVNAASGFVLEAFPLIYRRTLDEMRGKFSRGELSSILDVFNGLMWSDPALLGQNLMLQVSDGIVLDGLDAKWQFDKDSFLERLSGLSFFQKCALELWAANFWERDRYQGETAAKDWCEALL